MIKTGYTHYFPQKREATPEQWAKFIAAIQPVLQRNKEILCSDSEDPLSPIIADAKEVCFNGRGDDGHETFGITQKMNKEFNFCKTARKPYDKVVCAVLLHMRRLLPGCYDISSDGDARDEEWQDGLREFAQDISDPAERLVLNLDNGSALAFLGGDE